MPINELKSEVLARHGSIHAFCTAHPELARASVYLLFSGKYPGNYRRQLAKIRQSLLESSQEDAILPGAQISESLMAETLQNIRCGNCRRLNRRECLTSRDQTAREAAQLYATLYLSG